LALGLAKGWSLALALLFAYPFISLASSFIKKVYTDGYMRKTGAYAKSSGYADQALNSIKVISAFGQEEKEIKNYNDNLQIARD
jgi:ABC-type multidrug transport system fused ATPase/permease subunit